MANKQVSKKGFRELLLANERAFYATLVCVATLLINLIYYIAYNTQPLVMISILPIIFWIAYDGNEKEIATTKGYWLWVIMLLLTCIFVTLYPLF